MKDKIVKYLNEVDGNGILRYEYIVIDLVDELHFNILNEKELTDYQTVEQWLIKMSSFISLIKDGQDKQLCEEVFKNVQDIFLEG